MNELEWNYTEFYSRTNVARTYPNEYLVRIFMGRYPNLTLDRTYQGKELLDIGMGDGRKLKLFCDLGFRATGTEITPEISTRIERDLRAQGYPALCVTGHNHTLLLADRTFDYAVFWNSCYYMGPVAAYHRFGQYVAEFARVLRTDGTLVLSAPMASCFIFDSARELPDGYSEITSDPYRIRNHQAFRRFLSVEEIIGEFSGHFTGFRTASLVDDCFGQANHWHIIVCTRT